MIRNSIVFGLVVGLLALMLPADSFAQRPTDAELGPFPENRLRPTPETDLIENARMTTTSYGFLKLHSNPRSAGMGDAFLAVGDDLSAIFNNPAGITQIQRYEILGSYMKWIVGSKLGTFSLGAKTKAATFAVNFMVFQTEEFEETTSAQPAGTGRMVTAGNLALGLAVAKQVTDKLSVGGNFRWVQEDLDLITYSSIDMDIGTLFYTGYRSTRLGMSLRNLGGDKDVVGQKARFPMLFGLSGAAEVYGNLGDEVSVTVAVEQVFYTDAVNKYHFGTEAWVNNMIALRAGYKIGYDSEDWSIGFGLKQKVGEQTVKVDFSYSNAEPFGTHPIRLSAGLAF